MQARRTFFETVALSALLALAGCSGAEPDDRIKIENDEEELSGEVEDKDDPIEVQAAGAANTLMLLPEIDYELTLIAEVSPPEVGGQALQATSIDLSGGMAVVSYSMVGAPQLGAVDVFTFDADLQPTLTARAIFEDSDVHSVTAANGRVYLATGTADESFGTPAVLEVLSVTPEGALSLDEHTRTGLSSYAATSVAVGRGAVYATTGNTGHLHAFEEGTMEPIGAVPLDDARWVDVSDDALVVVQGTPGRLTTLAARPLGATGAYAFAGANIPESKSTVELVGGKAIVAGGAGGTFVFDARTGEPLGHVPVPAINGLGTEVVTNAVSADGQLMFVSNGAAGVYLVMASQDLSEPLDDTPLAFQTVGRLVFPGDLASANHITYKDGFLFVASGLGGLKIVRVERVAQQIDPPTGYPYASDFDTLAARAGWTLSGDWGFGLPDGDRQPRSGDVFIDNNPALADQYDHSDSDNIALLDLPLELPADGALPVLELWYSQALLHGLDAVYVEVQDPNDGRWDVKAAFTPRMDRDEMALREVWLHEYAGKTVRVRLRQHMSKAHGARRFGVDDLRVGTLELPTYDYPFASSHESEARRDAWNLEGAWSFSDAGGFEGDWFVDANAGQRDLAGYSGAGQTATMRGWVDIPAKDGAPAVGLWYRADLVGDNDKVRVQIQRRGETVWRDLTTIDQTEGHAAWTYREIDLSSYRGDAVRLRFVLSLSSVEGVRQFAFDDVRIGDVAGDDLPYPYATSFEGDEEQPSWVTGGAWGLGSVAFSGDAALDANPLRQAQPSFGTDHASLMTGFVALPLRDPATLSYRFQLELFHVNDRVYVDLQTKDDGDWKRMMTYSRAHNRAGWIEQEIDLARFAGREVRLRVCVSFANTLDVRTFRMDDVRIGGPPEARFAYPYRATFDGTELAEQTWALTGSWDVVAADLGGALDLNPDGDPQADYATGHAATMRGFVPLPSAGRPTLTVALRFALTDPEDGVHLDLQQADDGRWYRLRTYTQDLNHPDLGWDEIPLTSHKGQDVRVRLTYNLGPGRDPRVFQVDDVHFGPLILDNYAYPWATGFETEEEASEWSLWGAWSTSTAHGSSVPATGVGFLDGHADAPLGERRETLQTATLNGYITLPADQVAWLTLSHRFDGVTTHDRLYVELQTATSDTWIKLGTLDYRHARGEYAALELPLNRFAGQAVRLRLRQSLGASETGRVITVDDVAIGPLAVPHLPYPYVAEFATEQGRAAWQLHGTWGMSDDGWLDANPEGRDLSNYDIYQTATLDGVVAVPKNGDPVASIDYVAELIDDDDDSVHLEVQRLGEPTWTRLITLRRQDNATEPTSVQASLAGFAGDLLRFRFQLDISKIAGVRSAAIRQLRVGKAQ